MRKINVIEKVAGECGRLRNAIKSDPFICGRHLILLFVENLNLEALHPLHDWIAEVGHCERDILAVILPVGELILDREQLLPS